MKTIAEYLLSMDFEKREVVSKLREVVSSSIDKRFEETLNYGMITYVVPLSIYEAGYLKGDVGLPYISIAAQKNYISYYNMAVYGDEKLLSWFKKEYEKLNIGKLEMGKSCIRFKNLSKVPYELLGKLSSCKNVDDIIKMYEKNR